MTLAEYVAHENKRCREDAEYAHRVALNEALARAMWATPWATAPRGTSLGDLP